MNKIRVRTVEELRAELLKLGEPDFIRLFDQAITDGQKVTAIGIARKAGILLDR